MKFISFCSSSKVLSKYIIIFRNITWIYIFIWQCNLRIDPGVFEKISYFIIPRKQISNLPRDCYNFFFLISLIFSTVPVNLFIYINSLFRGIGDRVNIFMLTNFEHFDHFVHFEHFVHFTLPTHTDKPVKNDRSFYRYFTMKNDNILSYNIDIKQ